MWEPCQIGKQSVGFKGIFFIAVVSVAGLVLQIYSHIDSQITVVAELPQKAEQAIPEVVEI